VYAHGKGPNGHFAVCIHTAKRPRGGHLYTRGAGRSPVQALCRASCRTAHGKARGTTHGKHLARQLHNARQHCHARQNQKRTVKIGRMAKIHDARQRKQARQRFLTHGKERDARKSRCRVDCTKRTAKNSLPGSTLPCARCRASTHGKDVAVRFSPFAVRSPRTAKHCSPVVKIPVQSSKFGVGIGGP
jgi:hypothetical protein